LPEPKLVIIVGWMRRATILGAKFDECTNCGVAGPHLLIRKTSWFTLFWVPLMLLWASHGVLCPECGALENVSMLAMRRALKSKLLPLGRQRPRFEAALREALGGADPADWAAFGLEPGASEAEIRGRWRELAKQLHPDAGGDVPRFVTMQATFQRLLASDRSSVTSLPDAAELFDPIMENPKKGPFDFYSTKLWPGAIVLLIVMGLANPSSSTAGSAGTRTSPGSGSTLSQPVNAPAGTMHRCWYTSAGLEGCQDDTSATMLFGTQTGTATYCWFYEPLDYGETARCN